MQVGSYRLLEQIGAGGMGRVWRAHDVDGADVAVKVLGSAHPRQFLQREIYTTARLDHPGIIRIHRWGAVDADESTQLGVASGAPWIAMEFASEGTLDPGSITTWPQLRDLAASVLDALMHSHARSVIHRDIKPANILVRADHRYRYVLSDFGIAFPKDRPASPDVDYSAAGTLGYMPPEQLRGQWRDFGPYTDLYSLGVVIYEIVFGALPFVGRAVQIGMAQSEGPNLSRQRRFPIPEELIGWLQRLLAFDPGRRFAFAADAAFSLLHAGSPGAKRSPGRPAIDPTAPTLTMPVDWTTVIGSAQSVASVPATVHLGDGRVITRDWRAAPDTPAKPLGLDLYGLRRAQLVGRIAERDTAWSLLVDVVTSGQARVLVIEGEDGIGASHLARWLMERATELGMAVDVPVGRPAHGSPLAAIVRRALSLRGLERDQRRERLGNLFGDPLAVGLVDNLVSERAASVPDQVQAVEAVLRQFSKSRPIVIWLDDAHTDHELLDPVLALGDADIPALFVMTVRPEALADLPHEQQILDQICARPRTTTMRLEPLSADETGEFVDRVLAVDDATRTEIVERSAGNALHAVLQLEAVAAASEVIDGDIRELWRARLDAVLAPSDRLPLLAAAVLGGEIDLPTWFNVSAACSIDIPDGLADRLIAARLWVDHGVIQFEHPSLRDVVLQDADREARRQLHAAAARLSGDDSAGAGRHLMQAGQFEDGARALFETAMRLLTAFRVSQTQSLRRWAAQQLESIPSDNPAHQWVQLIGALIDLREFRNEAAYDIALHLAENAARHEHLALLGESLRVAALANTDSSSSLDEAERSLVAGRESGDTQVLTRALQYAAWCHHRAGEHDAALPLYEDGTLSSDPLVRSRCYAGKAAVLVEQGKIEAARHAYLQALEVSRSAGLFAVTNSCLNELADLERLDRNYEVAASYLDEAIAHSQHAYDVDTATPVVNLAAVKLGQVQTDRARELVREGLSLLSDPDPYIVDHCDALLAVAAAQDGDIAEWARRLTPAARSLRRAEYGALWELAADAWRASGDFEREREAVQLGLDAMAHNGSDLWRRLTARAAKWT